MKWDWVSSLEISIVCPSMGVGWATVAMESYKEDFWEPYQSTRLLTINDHPRLHKLAQELRELDDLLRKQL